MSKHDESIQEAGFNTTLRASIPSAVYVIIGSSGEYSDRHERVVGFVLTEEDAKAAVIQAEHERRLPDPIPYPHHEQEYAYQCSDGSWYSGEWYNRPKDAVFRQKPDAAEIAKRREAGIEAWRKARADAGRIDIDGSEERYYYERADAIAIETRSAETATAQPEG